MPAQSGYTEAAMPRFPGVDYLLFDSLLSEEELLVRQTARTFADERAIPLMRDAFRDGSPNA